MEVEGGTSVNMAFLPDESPKQQESRSLQQDQRRFFWLSLAVLAVLVTLYGLFTEYPSISSEEGTIEYIFYLHVVIMLVFGFAYLTTALRFYGISALGFTLLITVLSILIGCLTSPFFTAVAGLSDWSRFPLSSTSLLQGTFAAAAVLISYGALIGKLTPTQTLLLVLLEVPIYSFNKEVVAISSINTLDMGGTIFIHLFGCYFGLAASFFLGKPHPRAAEDADSSRISDMFSFIGTLFLWVYWPSFNGATAGVGQDQQMYTTVNTVLALCGSTISTFVASRPLNRGRISVADVQNATLAGGVAVGASSNLLLTPAVALGVGIIAGLISTWGFNRLSSVLEGRFLIHDTAGVHNLHGLPAILGTVVVAVATSLSATTPSMPQNIEDPTAPIRPMVYPAGGSQPWAQIGGAVATLLVAVVGGAVTGALLAKLSPNKGRPADDDGTHFQDGTWWTISRDMV